MAQMEVGMNGIVGSALPTASGELQEGKARLGRYREQYALNLVPTKHLLAEEGSYFVSSNQSPGTTVARNAAVTSFTNTVGLFHLFNTAPAGGKRVYVDFLKMILAAVGTGEVSLEFALAIDTATREPAVANRTLLTPVNVNMESSTTSVARVSQYLAGQPFTVTAPTANVRYYRGHVATSLGIVGDEYLVKCGGEDLGAMAGATAARLAATARMTAYLPPIIVGPQQSLTIHMWWLTESGASTWELEFGHWER
jgi:hypothetical protein